MAGRPELYTVDRVIAILKKQGFSVMAADHRANEMSKQRRRQICLIADGKCPVCGKVNKATTIWSCDSCKTPKHKGRGRVKKESSKC